MSSVNNDPPELMPVIILAGGLATRLRPLTERIPKALIEIAGRPFLWHQLELLKSHGIRRVVLAVGYLGERIQDQFGDGSKLGISLDYSFDGPTLLGTAGAIRKALPLLPERFFVLYGDSYLPCEYRAVETGFCAQRSSRFDDGVWQRRNVRQQQCGIRRRSNRELRQKEPNALHAPYRLWSWRI